MYKIILSIIVIFSVSVCTFDASAQRRGPGLEARENPSLGQRGGGRGGFGGGRGGFRGGFLNVESTKQSIKAIEEQVAALHKALEGFEPPSGQPGPNVDFRALMDDMRKRTEAIQAAANAINDQVLVLKGRQATTEFEEEVAELESLAATATDEKATKTAEMIQKLIQSKREAFREKAEKLGIPSRGGRGGRSGFSGPPDAPGGQRGPGGPSGRNPNRN